MIEISNLRIPLTRLDGSEQCELRACRKAAARRLGIKEGGIRTVELRRRSVDARKRSAILVIFTVRITTKSNERELVRAARNNVRLVNEVPYALPRCIEGYQGPRPVVVGAGCAGLFCALALASAGLNPLLIERGDDAERRSQAVRHFEQTGELDTESNIQFGLGGAGTFSDGKLGTGTKSPAHRMILEALVEAGAQRRILWDAKPHVGSDVLPNVVTSLVNRIIDLGGEVRFRTHLCELHVSDNRVRGLTVATEGATERIDTNNVILACGHSARDVFCLLSKADVALEQKTFAMGLRIEHAQETINRALYGRFWNHPALGPAPYKFAEHLASGRSLFSFCMCPGGYVVAATSEREGVVTNGMSLNMRDGTNANAALLVNVTPEDYRADDVFGGVDLQIGAERSAFAEGMNSGTPYAAPAQLLGDFLQKVPSTGPGRICPTYPRGVSWGDGCDLCLPPYITETMREALPRLERKIKGFASSDAVLTGVESRSSSPIRVPRTKEGQSISTRGLWPCGEGAGYAGGIMSAATDGLNTAEALLRVLTGDAV